MDCYFDNNATTMVPERVVKAICKWFNTGNPSAQYKSAVISQEMIMSTRQLIAKTFSFSLDDYYVIFNSGASEGNCSVLLSAARAYKKITGKVPHFVVSSVEHKSLLNCIDDLVSDKLITVTRLPAAYRSITPAELEAAIQPNTALISIMAANNETGILNNLAPLTDIAHKHNIPFHSDSVQITGKMDFSIRRNGLDAVTLSFHKFHGPVGLGLCIIRKDFISGYKMCPVICGTQNYALRGGTENVPLIAGAYEAMRYTFYGTHTLGDVCDYVAGMRNYIVEELSKRFKCFYISQYGTAPSNAAIELAGPKNPVLYLITTKDFVGTLPNTILIAVYKPKVCNAALRAGMEARGVIIGIGSACDKSSESHVVRALKVPELLRPGMLRISLSSENTKAECKKLIEVFTQIV